MGFYTHRLSQTTTASLLHYKCSSTTCSHMQYEFVTHIIQMSSSSWKLNHCTSRAQYQKIHGLHLQPFLVLNTHCYWGFHVMETLWKCTTIAVSLNLWPRACEWCYCVAFQWWSCSLCFDIKCKWGVVLAVNSLLSFMDPWVVRHLSYLCTL